MARGATSTPTRKKMPAHHGGEADTLQAAASNGAAPVQASRSSTEAGVDAEAPAPHGSAHEAVASAAASPRVTRRRKSLSAAAEDLAASHQDLSHYIEARFERCSRSQRDVAQYIVDHLDEVAFQTAEELARKANTSSSTVVRFSQALGFEGFPELQAAARDQYKRMRLAQASAPAGAEVEMPLFPLDRNEFEASIAADEVNLQQTAAKISRGEVEKLVAAIADSERILVLGADQMAFFASYLRHLLMLLDFKAEVAISPSQEALSRLSRIDSKTLVIVLCTGRAEPLIVRALKLARHRKATTVAITDATLSDVRKLATIKLYYSSSSPSYVRSHAALLSVIQGLAHAIYAQNSDAHEERIRAFRLK